jgi:Rieske Fe-S protein
MGDGGRQIMSVDSTRALRVLDRRDFLSQSVVGTLAAMVMSACGDGITASGTAPGDVNVSINLADYPALTAVGGIARLNGTRTPIAVVHSATESYRAFSMICPHAGTTIGVNGAGFRCPNHGATFAASGAWTGGERTSGLFEFTTALNAGTGALTITS